MTDQTATGSKKPENLFRNQQNIFYLLLILFALFACIIFVRLFWRTDTPQPPVVVKVEQHIPAAADGKTVSIEASALSAALQETADNAFYMAHQNAREEYEKSLSVLLAILTIFGIAWPLLIALIQFKFNESELRKIEAANSKATKSLERAEDANKTALQSQENAKTANDTALKSLKDLNEQIRATYHIIAQLYYDMGCDRQQTETDRTLENDISNHYFTEAIRHKLRSFEINPKTIANPPINDCLAKITTTIDSTNKKSIAYSLRASSVILDDILAKLNGPDNKTLLTDIKKGIDKKIEEIDPAASTDSAGDSK